MAIDVPFTVDADLDLGRASQPWLRGPGADVRICRGAVPMDLRRVEHANKNWQCAGERALVRGPRGTRCVVEGGRSIVYAVSPSADPMDVRLFLMGQPWLALAAQRGLLPLHASAVRVGAAVHAFGGVDGAGKSTLVAALAAGGHVFFGDDSLLLEQAAAADELCCYAYKDLKLDRKGAALANVSLGSRASTRESYGKHYVQLPKGRQGPRPAVCRLKTLSLLVGSAQPRCTVATLAGRRAMEALHRAIRRRGLVAAIYGTKRYADWMARIVGAVEVRVVRRSMEDHLFQSALAAIAATLPAAASDDGGPGKAD